MIKTQKGTVIKKSTKYGVGKQVGNTIYLHKSVEDRLPKELLEKVKFKLPEPHQYDIIKYDENNDNFTFIISPDWDSADEPIVGDAFLIRGDGSTRYMKQKKSPQIYHHKWLFVNDDYSGFNTEESKERSSKWLKLPDIEFSKIGYKNYWDTNVVPHLNENRIMKKELIVEMSYSDISPEEIMRANKSSRSSGAVGPKALTPRMVLQYIKDTGNKDIKILDFGSGKDAKHTYALREMGLDVTAHDFSSNINDEHHDPNALDRVYDIVFASNVLNVQGSENMMRRTVEDILKSMTNDSVFIANFPSSPRYGFETAKEAKGILEDYFDIVVIHGSDGGRTSSPVWAMSKKTEIVESFNWGDLKKLILKEDKIKCPDGQMYDSEEDSCVEITELPEISVVAFENDEDGSIKKSYGKYAHRLAQLEELLEEEGLTVGDEFYFKNHRKPTGGYSADYFDYLYELVDREYSRQYENAERYKRDKFIENVVRPKVGLPYVWGAMGPDVFDCSGLICNVFDMSWKHNAQMLYDKSDKFDKSKIAKLKVGDIVYFDYHMRNPEKDKSPEKIIEHVGIISSIDGGKIKMIHAGGDEGCTNEKYLAGKLPSRCRVKEVNYGPKWRRKTKAFGRLKGYEY